MTNPTGAALTDYNLTWLLTLLCIPGMGPVRARQLIQKVGPNGPALFAYVLSMGAKYPSLLTQARALAHEHLAQCSQFAVSLLPYWHPSYPSSLFALPDYPLIIYYKGSLKFLNPPGIALVGTRSPSPTGVRVTQEMARCLSQINLTVISGLAAGIDTAAHTGSLNAFGSTLAVLGSGLGKPYPRQNHDLFQTLVKKGLVLSEYPPLTQPLAHQFVRRNRLIAALSKAVFVLESRLSGGALATAGWANRLNLPLLAFPGHPEVHTSSGPRELIKLGAQSINTPAQLINFVQTQILPPQIKHSKSSPTHHFNNYFSHLDKHSTSQNKNQMDPLYPPDPSYLSRLQFAQGAQRHTQSAKTPSTKPASSNTD